jgi:predicted NAD/FAD-dependent oxidoreductase
MVVHSTNAWADKHIDDEAASVKQEMLREIARVTGTDVSSAKLIQLQRWRYANIEPQSGPSHILEPALRLAACGDWLVRGRVEAAFLSGTALAGQLDRLKTD